MHRKVFTGMVYLFTAGLLLFTAGCDKGQPLVIEAYHVKAANPRARFMAGAAEEEITPYPGIPLGGHGPAGRIARGTWMPLYARAFYFEDAAGHQAVMAACDLFAVSAGLRAEILRQVNLEERLEPGALILAATHTHHGPANFASAESYNGFAGPLPNFDKNLFSFLSQRIARAIIAAIQEAHQHAHENHELRLYSGYAVGIQRNRAIVPFYQNGAELVRAVQQESYAAGTRCPDGGQNCPRYLCTDPALKVLEIRRGNARRALLVFYAVHPTAMSHDSELYSPDFTGLAMKQLEIAQPGVVAGYFNGAEGDVSPDWERQDRQDVLTLGGRLAKAVEKVLGDGPQQHSGQIHIAAAWNRARQGSTAWTNAHFTKPKPGAGEFGGAEDGRTTFYNFGFRGEVRNRSAADPKASPLQQPLADFVDALELKAFKPALAQLGNRPEADSFPAEFPVARLDLSPLATFASIPVEATTLVGRAIRDRLGPKTVVVGLANEYFSYTTTREEYAVQQYEGASTMLGPDEASGIVNLLAEVQADPPEEVVEPQTFRPGKWREQTFGPDLPLLRVPRNMIDDDLQPLYPAAVKHNEWRVPRFAWTEGREGDHNPGERRAGVYSGARLIAEDRSSTDILTVLDGAPPGASTDTRGYDALWIPPDVTSRSALFYFQVHTGDGKLICSEPFRLADLEPVAPPLARKLSGRCPARYVHYTGK